MRKKEKIEKYVFFAFSHIIERRQLIMAVFSFHHNRCSHADVSIPVRHSAQSEFLKRK